MADQVIGRWKMEKIVLDGTDDVTAEHNPADNRFFIFKPDNTFESGGDPHGRNTGKWTIDESTGRLYIDSDAGENDDSYWIVTVDGDRMHWQGTHFEFNSRFAIDHVRVEE